MKKQGDSGMEADMAVPLHPRRIIRKLKKKGGKKAC